MLFWSKTQDRRTAMRSFLGFFAGFASVSLPSVGKTEETGKDLLNQLTQAENPDISILSEQAALFKSFESNFDPRVLQQGMEHHAMKSSNPQACLAALRSEYTDSARALLLEKTKENFIQATMQKLSETEKQLLAKILKNQHGEVGVLIGKIFEARQQALVQAFEGLDQEMATFAENFSLKSFEISKAENNQKV